MRLWCGRAQVLSPLMSHVWDCYKDNLQTMDGEKDAKRNKGLSFSTGLSSIMFIFLFELTGINIVSITNTLNLTNQCGGNHEISKG